MSETTEGTDLSAALGAALGGGPERHHEKTAGQGKMPVRERVARLVDAESFTEEALLANWDQEGLGADGVVTGLALIAGRKVALMANDPTVKAGSWGPKTVEKILRIQERALALEIPMVYMVDSAGARITEQVRMFPGRRGAGRIFYNEVRMSGRVPQVCVLFGPSAAGGAYIPAFCDVVIMREGNASMYLGSPRMAEMVIGEKVTLEEMGGAKMHTGVSGCGHFLAKTDEDAIDLAKRYLSYMPESWRAEPPSAPPAEPAAAEKPSEIIPGDEKTSFDIKDLIAALFDADSFCEVHARWAKELVVGYARLDGRAVGIVANQPRQKGGVLFVDSADKAARFISTCNAFNIPLVFLADVPGFMIGTDVERQGIIRHGAKMISAVSEATVPKISVIVRKAYGAGLYAMAGPAFEPDCTIALPGASIAVMGPEAAINAVFLNQIQAIEDEDERAEFVRSKREEYSADIDILHLASEMVVDAVIEPDDLRSELIRRFEFAAGRDRDFTERRNPITPALMAKLGVILGSGAAGIPVSEEIFAINRHGSDDEYVLPHLLDHVANVRSLIDAGCDRVLGVSSVGGLRPDVLPGTYLIPDDFIALDVPPLTEARGADAHIAPGFDEEWRREVVDALRGATDVVDGGVYWQVVGPRLETPAEVRMIAEYAHVVGMTAASECIVAAELGVPYACLAVVDNLANGVSSLGLTAADVRNGQLEHRPELEAVLGSALGKLAQRPA